MKSGFPSEYSKNYEEIINDNWKIWDEIVQFGYAKSSIEYSLKYDIDENLIQMFSNPSFSISARFDINLFDIQCQYTNLTLDCFCALYGSEKCFRYLILNGIPMSNDLFLYSIIGNSSNIIHYCDQNGLNIHECLNQAIDYHHYDLIEWLLNRTSFEPSMIFHIIKSNNVYMFLQFIGIYGDSIINQKDNYNWTPLHKSSQYGHLSIVEFLVSKGADINAKDSFDQTPLHFSTKNGHLSVVDLLVSKGADINGKDMYDWTPLHFAAKNGHLSVVEFLLLKGADINVKEKYDWTPLHFASQNGHLSVVEFLVSKGADTNAKNNYDRTPLHFASYKGHLSVVELLVSKGADINSKDKGGSTPLHYPSSKGHFSVVEFLVSKGADANTKNIGDETPFHLASVNGHLTIVEFLVSKGADITAKDKNSWTPFQYSSNNGKYVVTILIVFIIIFIVAIARHLH